MPKSKRAKLVSLATTKKKISRESKEQLVTNIQDCVDDHAFAYVIAVENSRNQQLKQIRSDLTTSSKFFAGKNKIMKIALGNDAESEFRPNLHKLSEKLSGQQLLMFTNLKKAEVKKYFAKVSVKCFARSGILAEDTISLQAGPLTQFQHDQEPMLRQLGMPTALNTGVIQLLTDFDICHAGDILTPEQCRLLKLFGHKLAEFRVKPVCCWQRSNGSFSEKM
eukprot:TRINITY_DN14595_c0_g1_i1.p1 TRINITY_DN14595_c0_g1~~TRINITY_DN14595_c0_g1_i1.p1  ORF type:complete len:241 (-),score=33.01 TRINITY_DN14595_c0_g1_i1:18-683(-)